MESDTFEKAFEEFLDCREYDTAQDALYALARKSFKAGWQAAGNESLQANIRLMPKDLNNEPSK